MAERPIAEFNEPPAVVLLGASVVFPAPEGAYENVNSVLVANKLDIVTNGHYFEQTEVWSEMGDLLIAARLLRRNQDPTTSVEPTVKERS